MHCKAKSFSCGCFVNFGNLEKDPAGLNDCYPIFGGTFTGTHAGFGGFFGYGLVGEDVHPDFAVTLHVTGHGNTRCLNLVAGDPSGLHCYKTIFAVSDDVTALSGALHASAVYPAAFYSFRH